MLNPPATCINIQNLNVYIKHIIRWIVHSKSTLMLLSIALFHFNQKKWTREVLSEQVRYWVNKWGTEWTSEVLSEQVRYWVSKWGTVWASEVLSEQVRYWVNKWDTEWTSEVLSEQVRYCVNKWGTEWTSEVLSEQVRYWVNKWVTEWTSEVLSEQEGNADPTLKSDFYIFIPILQHKKTTLNTNYYKNHVKCQGHLNVKVIMQHVCEKVLTYETMCVSMK